MNKAKMRYFEKEDILHITISSEPEVGTVEIRPNLQLVQETSRTFLC